MCFAFPFFFWFAAMESHNSSLAASPAPDSSTAAHVSRAAKTHPQIKIEPNCLVFPPPHFGRCIQNAISVYNVSKLPCIFKMRSQNPERYVAKPHVAVVAAESATRIFVTLRDMNTLGIKNLPEDTHDRFRISIKLYDPATVDASLAPKELWNVLQERGAKVDHEQDLVSYFTKRDTPVGGLVTFFPPTYIPVTPTAPHRAGGGAAAVGSAGENGVQALASAGGSAVARALGADMSDAAKKASALPVTANRKAPAGAAAAAGKGGAKKGADGEAGAAAAKKGGGRVSGNKMPALWAGIAVAAVVVVSLAVVAGVAVRGRRSSINSGSSDTERTITTQSRNDAHPRLQEVETRLQAEEERAHAAAVAAQEEIRCRAQKEEAERARAWELEQERLRREAAEAEAARIRTAQEAAERVRAAQQREAVQAQQQQQHDERQQHDQQQRQEVEVQNGPEHAPIQEEAVAHNEEEEQQQQEVMHRTAEPQWEYTAS